MDRRKYQIFISSTFEDLKDERQAVRDAILCMHQFPVGMETFVASSRTQWDIIKDTLDETDYYVLILGSRYGTEIKDGKYKGISYTEREYRYAKELGLPILAFIKKDDPKAEVKESSSDGSDKLAEFKEDVKNQRMVDFWSAKDDLKTKVVTSLYQEIDYNKRPGWIRGGNADTQEKIATHSDKEKKKNREYNPDKYDLIINELKFSGDGMTVSELVEETEFPKKSVKNMLERLVELGMVDKIDSNKKVKYMVVDPFNPSDGYHVFYNRDGVKLKEGTWKDGELQEGTEYNWIVKDVNHSLKYNQETDDYDGDADTELTDYIQYDDDFFSMYLMDAELEHEGLEHYYVADVRAHNGLAEYVNIRKLEDWLEVKESIWLKLFRKHKDD